MRHETVTFNFSRSTFFVLQPVRNAAFFYSAEVFSVPEITKLQQHDAGRARIAARAINSASCAVEIVSARLERQAVLIYHGRSSGRPADAQ